MQCCQDGVTFWRMGERMTNGLLALRQTRGWSQTKLAAAAGITRQSYAAIESGGAIPSTEVALRLALALGRPVEQIFRLAEQEPELVEARNVGVSGAGRARLARVAGELMAYPVEADHRRARLADGQVELVTGNRVWIRLLPERPPEPSLVAFGCDPAFGLVVERLQAERGLDIVWQHRSSRAALEALARGEAHVAGVHLRDPRTGSYNRPWVEKLVPFDCTVVTFAVWEQVLLVAPGNPLGVGGVADLARAELRFLNREPGSGSRTLLDEQIRAAGVEPERIPGYLDTRARGHLGVAEAIATGLADAGVGIRAAGLMYGLDAVPLALESYDLVIPNHFLDLPEVQALVDVLRRPALRAQVEALGGYDASGMGVPS
jgi:putative molybdopterin biosynthesis protein